MHKDRVDERIISAITPLWQELQQLRMRVMLLEEWKDAEESGTRLRNILREVEDEKP